MRAMRWMVVAVFAVAGTAWAGNKASYPVSISMGQGYGYASGGLGTARNSTDTVQYIGCQTFNYGGGYASMRCFARAANNVYGSCYSSELNFIDAAQSVGTDGYIEFNWDSNGQCTYLSVTSSSVTEPKR